MPSSRRRRPNSSHGCRRTVQRASSLAGPRGRRGGRTSRRARALEPPLLPDEAEFTERYGERLDGVGIEAFQQRFAEIAAAHDGRGLVFLCFEPGRGVLPPASVRSLARAANGPACARAWRPVLAGLGRSARRFSMTVVSKAKPKSDDDKIGVRGERRRATPRKRSTAKRSTTKRKAATRRRSTAKRSTAKRSTAKRSTAKRSTAKRSTAKRSTAKRSTAKRRTTRRRTSR
jgi:hypothetical protein